MQSQHWNGRAKQHNQHSPFQGSSKEYNFPQSYRINNHAYERNEPYKRHFQIQEIQAIPVTDRLVRINYIQQ